MRDCIHRFRICTYEYVHVDVYRGPVFAQCGYCDGVSRPLSASIVCHTWMGTTCADDHHLGCIHIEIQKRTKVNTEFRIELVAIKMLEMLKFYHLLWLLCCRCWWGYNFTSIYWILEGPRLAVLLLNFIFLLNIIRVLVVKLRQSHSSDIEQVRKAVRAAIVLIPLLGITNILNMTDAPLHKTALEFGIWSYTTHFLTSFQGLFIAMIYCFLNNEVRWGCIVV